MYWLNAADPASPCGCGLKGLTAELPARRPSSFLVFHGRRHVLTLLQGGKAVDVHVPPDHPRLAEFYAVFRELLGRAFNPRPWLRVETIAGEPALDSPYAPSMEAFGFTREYKGLELRPRMG